MNQIQQEQEAQDQPQDNQEDWDEFGWMDDDNGDGNEAQALIPPVVNFGQADENHANAAEQEPHQGIVNHHQVPGNQLPQEGQFGWQNGQQPQGNNQQFPEPNYAGGQEAQPNQGNIINQNAVPQQHPVQ